MRRITALVGVLSTFMLPSIALGQSSTCQQYNPQLCPSVGPTTGSTPTPSAGATPPSSTSTPPATTPAPSSTKPTPSSTKPTAPTGTTTPGTTTTPSDETSPATAAIPTVSSGSLPFTGLDVVLVLIAAGALLSAGFVIRRVSRRLD
jgi:hypothetical protein